MAASFFYLTFSVMTEIDDRVRNFTKKVKLKIVVIKVENLAIFLNSLAKFQTLLNLKTALIRNLTVLSLKFKNMCPSRKIPVQNILDI